MFKFPFRIYKYEEEGIGMCRIPGIWIERADESMAKLGLKSLQGQEPVLVFLAVTLGEEC